MTLTRARSKNPCYQGVSYGVVKILVPNNECVPVFTANCILQSGCTMYWLGMV